MILAAPALLFITSTVRVQADRKARSSSYVFDLSAPESEVVDIVREVAADSIVRGTYVYEKEKVLTGAHPENSTSVFPPWQGAGKVFYKTYLNALAPRHFRNSSDIGTITVRYVVASQDAARTQVSIDAVYVEDARRKAHASDGSIELAEFGAIQERLKESHTLQPHAVEVREQPSTGAHPRPASEPHDQVAKSPLPPERLDQVITDLQPSEHGDDTAGDPPPSEHQDNLAGNPQPPAQQAQPAVLPTPAQDSVGQLETRLHTLQHELELQVKPNGAELKTAPFHAAANLRSLPARAQVVVLILTPEWYGVQTTEGQRGWVRRDTMEPLP